MKFQNSALRLGIISLKAVNNIFDKKSFEQYGGGHTKILWETAKNVMEKAFGKRNRETALHLIVNLLYFETTELNSNILSPVDPRFLSILETCGLIHVVENEKGRLGKVIKLQKPGTAILEEFIRQENKFNEEGDLTRLFKILRRTGFPFQTYSKYFLGLWNNVLNHENLVKKLVENYYNHITAVFNGHDDRGDNFQALILKTLERFTQIFGELDKRTLEFRLHKIDLILESSKYTNRFKLNQSRELIMVCERFKEHNINSRLYTRIGKIARDLYTFAMNDFTLSDELKVKFLEESFLAHKMAWKFLEQSNPEELFYNKFFYITWLGMFESLNALKKYEQIGQLLNEIYKILLKYSEKHPSLVQDSLFSDYWDDIFSEFTPCSSDSELLNRDFRILIKFIFEFTVSKLKENKDLSGIWLLRVAKAYLICLRNLQDFDQILIVVRETNEVLKEMLYYEISHGWCSRWCNHNDVILISNMNHYFDFHKLLLEVIRDQGSGIGCVQDAILMESIEYCKSIVKNTFDIGDGRNAGMAPGDYRNGGPLLIISCYTYLGRIDELIEYSSTYRQLLLRKFGYKHADFASEWILYLKTLCKNINSIASQVNVKKCIESIESWTKEFSEGSFEKTENELIKSALKEIVEKLELISP